MLTLPPTVRVFFATEPTDMRRSFDGLAALVQARLARDPLDGHLYVFVNRRRDTLRVLFFDRSGWCILAKRLEVGTFELPRPAPGSERVEVDAMDLALILEGIDLGSATRRARYRRPNRAVGES